MPSWYMRNNCCILKVKNAWISTAEALSGKPMDSMILNAPVPEETVGVKANIGLIEKPPAPRVMEIAACITPLSNGPLNEILSPNCFDSSASLKSGQSRRWTNVLATVAVFHRGSAEPSTLSELGPRYGLYLIKGRHVQRWGDRERAFIGCNCCRCSSSKAACMRLGFCIIPSCSAEIR